MGQKVNPIGFRLGVNRDWRSRWYASPQEMPAFLHSDLEIRDYVKKKLQFAAVSKIVIERAWNFDSRDDPHRASRHRDRAQRRRDREDDGRDFEDGAGQTNQDRHPGDQDAGARCAVGRGKRGAANRAPHRLSPRHEKSGAGGDGFWRARNSFAQFGSIERRGNFALGMVSRGESVPLHTLRTPIDYGFAEANTVYGKIGVKCWMCKKEEAPPEQPAASAPPPPPPEPAQV